jgi:multicomponent Na+:H+ antiporter subunit F
MQTFDAILAIFLLVNLLVALARVMRGPSAADRMLAALLFGTVGVAILLLLAQVQAIPALNDVALVFALLAAITGVAFVRRAWREPRPGNPGDSDDAA